MAHIHMHCLKKLAFRNLVEGLLSLKFEKSPVCEACQRGKQIKNSLKNKNLVSTSRLLELLHMDLFVSLRTTSLGGNYCSLVIVEGFSRFTWNLSIVSKDDSFNAFKKFAKVLQNEKNCCISVIKIDHEGQFQNERFDKFCEKFGIKHHYLAPRTPQQNGVVERKNRFLEELTITLSIKLMFQNTFGHME